MCHDSQPTCHWRAILFKKEVVAVSTSEKARGDCARLRVYLKMAAAYQPYDYDNYYDVYDDEYDDTRAPRPARFLVPARQAPPPKSSVIGNVARYTLFTYAAICTLLVTVLLILWKHWLFIGTLGTNSSTSTNRTKGFMTVWGGMDPLKGPPATLWRVGRGVLTPLVYDGSAYTDDFSRDRNFFALSRRPNQSVAAYDLGEREGVRFVGDPNENGAVGFAPLDYRLMRVFNYNLPVEPLLPSAPIPAPAPRGGVSM